MIDTHHHFWHYDANAHGWIPDDLAAIRRDWLPTDLEPVLRDNGISGVVTVQAIHSDGETKQLLALANEHALILGVVGWADLCADDVVERIEGLLVDPMLVGLRHVLPGEPDDFADGAAFNRGVDALARAGLAYDLLITERDLPRAIAFADRHPDARLIVDHLAKPRNDRHELEPWRTHMLELARRPHVTCKLSGGITEIDLNWTLDSLRPYFDTVLEGFGPGRLMFGSNWPLTEPAGGYARWVQAVREYIAPLSDAHQHDIVEHTARRAYQLGGRA